MNFTTQQQTLVENTNLICKTLFQELAVPYGHGAILNGTYKNEGFGFDFFSDTFSKKETNQSILDINVSEFGGDKEKRVTILVCLTGLKIIKVAKDSISLQNIENPFLLSPFDNLKTYYNFNEMKLTRIGLDTKGLKELIEKCISDLGFVKYESISKKDQSAINDRAKEEEDSNYLTALSELRKLLD